MKPLVCFALLACLCPLKADQLPARAYTTADGLPVNRMNDILADRLGFLWFASEEGLTRFDGYQFQTFGTADGLPSKAITALLQDHDGTYWLGTHKGLCHFDGSTFKLYPFPQPNVVNVLFQDRRGRIWCGSINGLFVLRQGKLEKLAGIQATGTDATIAAITEDKTGTIWAAFLGSLWRISDHEPAVQFTAKDGLAGRISSLLTDARGRVWVGTWNGVQLLKTMPVKGAAFEGTWGAKDGLSSGIVQWLLRTSDGVLWALSEPGLTSWQESSDKPVFRIRHDAQGWLSGRNDLAAEDRQGSIWIGTESHGVIRVSLNGLTTFGRAEGLLSEKIRDLFEDQAGDLLTVTRIDSPDAEVNKRFRSQILYRLNNNAWQPVNPRYPESASKPGWGERQVAIQDHLGEWWISTEAGLFRFPAVPLEKLAETSPKAHYTSRDGLGTNDVFRLHEDGHGDIWVGTMGGGVFRWDRRTQRFQKVGDDSESAGEFQHDSAGNVWIGWWNKPGLGRFRNGQLEIFHTTQGLSPGGATDILQDHQGRLWITMTRGLSRIDDPAAQVPKIYTYAHVDALAGHRLECITEDRNGVLYIGTHNGLVEFNPATEAVRHLGMKDGLPDEDVLSAFCDRQGILWFGTHGGLVRLQPPHRPAKTLVPLRIVGLRMGGHARPVSKLGETSMEGLRLNPGENMLQIEYADLALDAAGPLQYQYLLGGTGSAWSPASKDRTLQFASLSPGRYALAIRAVDALGNPVSEVVTARFRVMPQFWQTWWFQLLCAALACGIVALIYRYRVSRLIAVQKLRSRIAFDLHDEVGSGLTQIAIWSELARQNGHSGGDDHLEQIAVSSRALVDTIGDIIWTVNPQRDSVRELVQRVRYFATEICTASDLQLQFEVNSEGLNRQANSEIRRDVFLIAKEAIHNAVRHAACSRIRIRFRIFNERLELEISDDGTGISAAAAQGNGMTSMRQRARLLGGRIEWSAAEGGGTKVLCVLPLAVNAFQRLRRKLPV
jgi:ligand-binding sensor domain-containing protein/two-component sensor histidine kinase